MKPVRKKSPAAPSYSLPAALERAAQIAQALPEPSGEWARYEAARALAPPYRSAAPQFLASLKMYGLIRRASQRRLRFTERFFRLQAARGTQRQALLWACLREPAVFARLLAGLASPSEARDPDALPSDAALQHKLVADMGFGEARAGVVMRSLRQSLAFVEAAAPAGEPAPPEAPASYDAPIPVRLSGGGRAWLTLPQPFYESDKAQLRAQVELICADDEGEEAAQTA